MSNERNAIPAKTIQFGAFTLDLESQRLIGASGPLDLRPKCFDALRYLVEHAGRVVGKSELLDAVWPHVTVSDESLTQCISEIRRGIGDERRQIIRTIARRGYLFDTPVFVGHSARGSGAADAPQSSARENYVASRTARSRLLRWGLVPLATTVVIAAIVLVDVTKPQAVQGSWRGFLNCEKLSFTQGPILAPFELTVSKSGATYARKVYSPKTRAIVGIETGTGTVDQFGTVILAAHFVPEQGNYSYNASYRGKLANSTATLRGTQQLQIDGEPYTRHCSVELERKNQAN
jgi:DNA-binding winged helix-turn-helix (wHTH) protein